MAGALLKQQTEEDCRTDGADAQCGKRDKRQLRPTEDGDGTSGSTPEG